MHLVVVLVHGLSVFKEESTLSSHTSVMVVKAAARIGFCFDFDVVDLATDGVGRVIAIHKQRLTVEATVERDRAGTLLETDHVHVDTDVVELFIERGFDGGFALVFAQSDRGLEDDWLERKGFERLHGLCVVVREVEESTDGRDSIDLNGIAVEIFHHAARCMCFLGHLVGLLDGCWEGSGGGSGEKKSFVNTKY